MATYDLKVLAATPCAQFTGTPESFAAVQAICGDARLDPTEEQVVYVPVSHARTRVMYVGDWITSVETNEFLVLPDASFAALFTATP